MALQIYTASNLSGVYLNAAAVIVAHDAGHARRVLMRQLEEQGLKQDRPDEIKIEPLDTTTANCRVVWNGDY